MKKTTIILTILLTAYSLGLMAFPLSAATSEGLILYYTFDEADMDWGNASAEARDKSGYGNHGDVVDATSQPGKFGNALFFDSTTDDLNVGNGGVLDQLTALTVCVWIKPTSQPNSYPNVISKQAASAGWDLYLRNSGGFGTSYFNTSASYVLREDRGVSITNNEWHFLAITQNGEDNSNMAVYYNGELTTITPSASGTGARQDDSANMLRIGTASTGSYDFYGYIDELRLYNRALSSSEIYQVYQGTQTTISSSQTEFLTDGLVLMQSFDGPHMDWSNATAEARDQSTTSAHGNVLGGVTTARGRVGQALYFDGVDSRIDIGTSTALQPSNITVSYWLKRTISWNGLCDNTIVWTKGSSWSGNGWYIETNDRDGNWGLIMVVDGSNGFYIEEHPDDLFPLNEWVHIAATFNSSTDAYAMYINGVSKPVSQYNTVDSITATGDTKYIGLKVNDTLYLTGYLDELRIYNRVLSPSEIEQLYNLGGGGAQGGGAVTLGYTHNELITEGLVLNQTFDGPYMDWGNASAEARDASAQGNHGNAIGGVQTARGKVGQCLQFDGDDDYIDCGMPSSLSITSAISVAAWVYAEADDNLRIASKHNGPPQYGWMLARRAAGDSVEWRLSTDGTTWNGGYGTSDKFGINTWKHIVGTYDNQTMRVYVNGIEDTGGDFPLVVGGDIYLSDATTQIGRDQNAGDSGLVTEKIDEVRIYNRALSAREIDQLYTIGRGTD